MRKGLLGSLGVLLTGTGLVFAQVPYGYAPVQPYATSYGYPAYNYNYGYGYGYAPGYSGGYSAGYAPGYAAGYVPAYSAGYAPAYAPAYSSPPVQARPMSQAVAEASSPVPVRTTAAQNPAPSPEPQRVSPAEALPPPATQPPTIVETSTSVVPATPGTSSPAAELLSSVPAVSSVPATVVPVPVVSSTPATLVPVPSAPSAPSASLPMSPEPSVPATFFTVPASPLTAGLPADVPAPVQIPTGPIGHAAAGAACSGGACCAPTCGPLNDGACCDKGPCLWVAGDYLYWWFKKAPQPPLLTESNDAVTTALGLPFSANGALTTPGTTILNPNTAPFNPASGGRLTVGGWLSSNRCFGLEASGFLLQRQTNTFSASSPDDPNSTVVLAVPYINAVTGQESALQLSTPGVYGATASINNQLLLWGAELNAISLLAQNSWCSFGVLAGVRHIDLAESLNFNVNIAGNTGGNQDPPFFANISDRFATRNQFYGGQVGARGEVRVSQFFLNVTGKVALGPMYQSLNVNGSNTNNLAEALGLAAAPTSVPVGIFAQATNIGRHSQTEFGVVPEVQAQLGWQPWSWLRVYGGYNLIYLNSVVRPGDQIDRQLNPNNFGPFGPLFPTGLTTTSSPYNPAASLHTTNFWVNGVNAGIAFCY